MTAMYLITDPFLRVILPLSECPYICLWCFCHPQFSSWHVCYIPKQNNMATCHVAFWVIFTCEQVKSICKSCQPDLLINSWYLWLDFMWEKSCIYVRFVCVSFWLSHQGALLKRGASIVYSAEGKLDVRIFIVTGLILTQLCLRQ